MILLKGISIFLAIWYITIVITSNTSAQLSTVQASLSENRINDAIKKACPTYEDNNDNNIKGAVSNIIKSCIPQSNQPPTSPNPDTSPLDQNILHVSIANDWDDTSITVTTTDLITQKASIQKVLGSEVKDLYYVIPVGDTYTVVVASDEEEFGPNQVTFISNDDCTLFPDIPSCIGKMGDSMQTLGVKISPPQ